MKNIYVGNLDYGTTDETLRELFERFGAVEKVNLVRDRDTGQTRGFAFVEMTDGTQADRAIADLNGTMVGSRAISVNEARPKPAGGRPDGGFRRPGGGPPRQRREPRW
jgi:RNA recognition motif-containing protein